MKKLLIILLVLCLFSAVMVSGAEKYKLLFVDAEKGEPYKTFREGLFQALEDLGYINDDNLEITYYTSIALR